ncbi:MAG TPA: DUF6152 family protein [Vicinamibacterales bacterium]|nr:DUF6152 family protein [Vicinamibacterales bacterium]
MRIIRGTLIILALLAATSSALAHHSFAPFNLTAEKTLVGTIKQFDWTNPHTWIWIDVPNEKGVVETWGVEGMSPNFLARRGWSKTSFKPGDKATIVVRPMKDGSPGGMFVTATLSNGRKLTSGGAEPAAN